MVFYFKDRFKCGIEKMTSHSKQCMWVKFDGTFFGLNKDLYLGIIYIRPITNVQNREQLFEQLENNIIKYKAMGEIIVSRDLNARTGDKHDLVFEEDTQNRYDVPLPDFYIYDKSINKNNRDNTCNALP